MKHGHRREAAILSGAAVETELDAAHDAESDGDRSLLASDAGSSDAERNAGDAALNEIETVGFDQNDGAPVPVLLFKAGYASFNAWQIVAPIDIAYDLVEHPMVWPAWRRASEGVEIKTGSAWKPLQYKYVCSALPKGTIGRNQVHPGQRQLRNRRLHAAAQA